MQHEGSEKDDQKRLMNNSMTRQETLERNHCRDHNGRECYDDYVYGYCLETNGERFCIGPGVSRHSQSMIYWLAGFG